MGTFWESVLGWAITDRWKYTSSAGVRSCTRAFVLINWFDIFLWQPENLSFLLHKSNETFWWKPEKVFGGNCAQSKNLSAHLCITPTLAPQITSHLLVISSFSEYSQVPSPTRSQNCLTFWSWIRTPFTLNLTLRNSNQWWLIIWRKPSWQSFPINSFYCAIQEYCCLHNTHIPSASLLGWRWDWWSTQRANDRYKDHLDGQLKTCHLAHSTKYKDSTYHIAFVM